MLLPQLSSSMLCHASCMHAGHRKMLLSGPQHGCGRLQNGEAAQYMRHASGQFYGVSAPVARYIKQNAPILHHYANEVPRRMQPHSWMVVHSAPGCLSTL